MLSLPVPWVISVPAIKNRLLNGVCLAKVTLACSMRPAQHPCQKNLHIEWLAHARPPIVGRYHVDTTVPEFVANLLSGLLIQVRVELGAMAAVDGRVMLGDLLIAFARIGRSQLMKAFESMGMENFPCRADDSLLEIEVAFIRCKQVAATVGRDLMGECQGFADVIVHHYPARRRCT